MSSLLDRLEPPAADRHLMSRQDQTGQTFAAIKRHLERLLNTRQGCSQSSPDLGLRDFNGHALSSGDLLAQVSADIRRTIRLYEPRIRVCGLQCQPDVDAPLALHFRLDCEVMVQRQAQLLQIELLVNGQNRYTRVR